MSRLSRRRAISSFFPARLFIQVCDHLLQPVDTQVRLAQLGCSTLQRGDLVLVLLQQAVDRRDIVVDLLDGPAVPSCSPATVIRFSRDLMIARFSEMALMSEKTRLMSESFARMTDVSESRS